MKLVPSNDRKILPPIDSSLVTRMTEIQKLREKVRLAEAAEIFSRGMNLERSRRIKEPFAGPARSGRQAILTRKVLAGIPALVEQGLRKGDIAERLGCKEATLVVRCSVAGISLRGPKRFKLREGVPLRLSRETIASLSVRAAADGRSEAQLASDLLETIARERLYDAVLDSAPLS